MNDAFTYVAVVLSNQGAAKEQILSRLAAGELSAVAQRFYTYSDVDVCREERDKIIPTAFWEWAEVAWTYPDSYALRRPWFRPWFVLDPKSLDPTFTYQAFGVRLPSAEVRQLWPVPTVTAPSACEPGHNELPKPKRPKGYSLAQRDEAVLQKMKDLLSSGQATSPTDAAWQIAGADGQGAPGGGNATSKVNRLVKRLKSAERNGE